MSADIALGPSCNVLSKELHRPTGFNVVITMLLLGSFAQLIQIMPQIPAFILGKMMYGFVGTLFAFIFGVVGLLLTYGLYKLKRIALTFGLPWLVFEGVNGLLALFIFPPITIDTLLIISASSLITSISVLLYIHSKKEYFIC